MDAMAVMTRHHTLVQPRSATTAVPPTRQVQRTLQIDGTTLACVIWGHSDPYTPVAIATDLAEQDCERRTHHARGYRSLCDGRATRQGSTCAQRTTE